MQQYAEEEEQRQRRQKQPLQYLTGPLLDGLAAQHACDPKGVKQALGGFVSKLKARGNEIYQGVNVPLLAAGAEAALVDRVSGEYAQQCLWCTMSCASWLQLAGMDSNTTRVSSGQQRCPQPARARLTCSWVHVAAHQLPFSHGPIPSFTALCNYICVSLRAWLACPCIQALAMFPGYDDCARGGEVARADGRVLSLHGGRHICRRST